MKYLLILVVLLAGCVESERGTPFTSVGADRKSSIQYDGYDIVMWNNTEYMLRRVVGGYQHDYEVLLTNGYTYVDGDVRVWTRH